jgi:seryl-tRNA(Sec) selenium transferase
MSLTGAKLVWFETREEPDRAINPRIAMMFVLDRFGPLGAITRGDWLEVGKRRGVPTFLDAAADVPPISRFSESIREGFDLVTSPTARRSAARRPRGCYSAAPYAAT